MDSLSITEKAQNQLKKILSKNTDSGEGCPVRFRISVMGGGCSGFQYTFKIDDAQAPEDHIFGNGQSQVIVDSVSLELLKGAELDYEEELIGAQFIIKKNPQAMASCGCGSSFSIL